MKETWSNETLTVKLKNLCHSVEGLKKLRRWVWSSVAIFGILTVIGLGLRADIKDATASVVSLKEKHNAEYKELDKSFEEKLDKLERSINNTLFEIGKDLGRNEISHVDIAARLMRIEEKLDKIVEGSQK
jgi:hypothetical protein